MAAAEVAEVTRSPVRPLGDRVVVRPDAQETQTAGGVYLPDNITEKPKTGLVLAVGKGMVNQDGTRTMPDVREGDHVVFSTFAGVDIRLGDTSYLVLREGDILGVLEDGD